MSQQLNQIIVKQLAERYRDVPECLVVGCAALAGTDTSEMRRALAGKDMRLEIVRITLARRAFENTPLSPAVALFAGPTAILSGAAEFPEICRAAVEWSKKFEGRLELRGGVMDNRMLTIEDAKRLATIPSRDELYAKMMGAIQSPGTGVVSTLSGVARKLAIALNAICEKKEADAS